MRGMRNRVAHGYFDVDLNVVWDTTQTALPDLLLQVGASSPVNHRRQVITEPAAGNVQVTEVP